MDLQPQPDQARQGRDGTVVIVAIVQPFPTTRAAPLERPQAPLPLRLGAPRPPRHRLPPSQDFPLPRTNPQPTLPVQKKTLRAREQDRPDIVVERETFKKAMDDI